MQTAPTAANVASAFINLARLRIVGMVMVACAIGFIISYRGDFLFDRFFWTLIGTGLLSAGSCTLNCYLEREADALMPRTCKRPLPAGVITPATALGFGLTLILTGSLLLFSKANMISGLLGLLAAFVYLAIYTPAKKLTWLNTSIGALPGAIPPLIGWEAARGQIDFGGWVLFAMLFIWQHTHFFPIAWLYKTDYQLAGFRMLPVLEKEGVNTFRLTLITAIVLLPISMLLLGSNSIGPAYFLGAGLFGFLLIAAGFRFWRQPSRAAARTVLFLSLFYLPVIFGAVLFDRYGAQIGDQFHVWLETVRPWT
jgi:protoheme IX farnesyltransferase